MKQISNDMNSRMYEELKMKAENRSEWKIVEIQSNPMIEVVGRKL